MSDAQPQQRGMPGRSRWVLAGFIAIAAFFLLTEHRAHLYGLLPYLLLLACPAMHMFHSHHHGGGAGPAGQGPDRMAQPPDGIRPPTTGTEP